MYSLPILATLLTLPALILAQTTADPCVGQVGTSADRKIAIVIDSSGSNDWNDPLNLRSAAGKAIVANLVGTDQVAVVDFDDYATVVSPLGPPAAASFDTIDNYGGTYIAGGVEAAIGELTGAAANTGGIIVLTDGEDGYVVELVEQINIAAGLGIRVSFGFLNPSGTTQDPTILDAIIAANGIYANIDNAEAQANFVALVLSSGLVNADTASAGSTLILPGLRISGNVSAATSPNTYQYDALANEVLNVTVTAVTEGQVFDFKLKTKGGADIESASTDPSTGEGVIEYTVGGAAESLEIEVSTTNTTSGLFSIALQSSLNRTINVCGQNPGTDPTAPKPNGTATITPSTPTPTNTKGPIFSGAAAVVRGVAAIAVFPVLFAIAL